MVEVPARSLATTVLAVALVAAALGVAVPATADAPEAREAAFEPHPPIRIHGDEQFLLPGSGVVSGSGTANDPYVITGWELTPRHVKQMNSPDGVGSNCEPSPIVTPARWRTVRLHAIEIVDTSAHVVIEANRVVASAPAPGNVDSRHLIGILLVNADHVTIKGNQVGDSAGERLYRGICARQSDDLTIAGNTVEHTVNDAVQVTSSSDVVVDDNVLQDGQANPAQGVEAEQVTNLAVTGNEVLDYDLQGGILVASSPKALIDHNTVRRSDGIGIYVSGSDNVDVTYNVVTDHDEGISVDLSSGVEAHQNTIEANVPYGTVGSDFTVDATDNYWGCPDGPDDAACDDTWGAVDYDPWLSSPNALAGA